MKKPTMMWWSLLAVLGAVACGSESASSETPSEKLGVTTAALGIDAGVDGGADAGDAGQ